VGVDVMTDKFTHPGGASRADPPRKGRVKNNANALERG
jgi:hypothetical protein